MATPLDRHPWTESTQAYYGGTESYYPVLFPTISGFNASFLIPAYQYPTLGIWPQLYITPPIGTTGYVIVDIASGTLPTVDPNYTSAIARAQKAGWTCLGYVDTNYTAVVSGQVENLVHDWFTVYGIKNIFFDRADNTTPNIGYYTALTNYVHSNGGTVSFLNMGAAPAAGYLNTSVCDGIIVFENTYAAYQSTPPVNYSSAPVHIGHIVSACPSIDALSQIQSSTSLGADLLFVTDETDGAYNILPTYFANENRVFNGLLSKLIPILAGWASYAWGSREWVGQPLALPAFTKFIKVVQTNIDKISKQKQSFIKVVQTNIDKISKQKQKFIKVGQSYSTNQQNPINTLAYVTNYFGNSVSVINTRLNTVVSVISGSNYGFNGPNGVTLTPSGNLLYVTNHLANSISVINTPSNTLNTIISGTSFGFNGFGNTSSFSKVMAINPAGTLGYVSNDGNSTISVINIPANTLNTIISGNGLFFNNSVAINPAGTLLYGVNFSVPSISVFNIPANTANTIISGSSYGFVELSVVSFDPAGNFLYVVDAFNSNVVAINLPSNTFSSNITVGNSPQNMVINSTGSLGYVVNYGTGSASTNTISVLNIPANTINTTISQVTGSFHRPMNIAINSDGTDIYAPNESTSTLSIINVPANTLNTALSDTSFLFNSLGNIDITTTGNFIPFVSKGTKGVQTNITRFPTTYMIRIASVVWVNTVRLVKQKNWVPKVVQIQTIKVSKLVSKIVKPVRINTIRLGKTITKNVRAVFVEKAGEIGRIFYRMISAAMVYIANTGSGNIQRIIVMVQVNAARINKQKNAILRTVQVRTARISKLKITSIKLLQTNIARINKIKTSTFRVVKIQSVKLVKSANKNIHTVQVQALKLRKSITKNVHTVWVNTVRNSKTVTKFKKLVQINIARINKQKNWIARSVFVQSIKQSKTKNAIVRGVKISSAFARKSVAKSVKSVYVQKSGELGRIFYRIIATTFIQSTKLSKSLVKSIKSNLIRSTRLSKTKSTNITTTEVQNARINKQKRWNAKVDRVQSVKFTKTKSAILKVVEIFANRLSKQKNTTIKSTAVSSMRLKKKASKSTQAAQIVSATVTRATNRDRRITSGLTYTIASSRSVTRYRQFKAVMVNALRTNKGIKKDITVSSTNISSILRASVPWKFLIQFVTKIVSSKSQTIEKPGHARPDPDFWDPNMIDSSTPGVDGLVYGNPDDDR